jgi:hypothetical protein
MIFDIVLCPSKMLQLEPIRWAYDKGNLPSQRWQAVSALLTRTALLLSLLFFVLHCLVSVTK